MPVTGMQIPALSTLLRAIGRASIWYATKWDGSSDLELSYLGDTEGAVERTPNEEYSVLTAPEITGPAPLEKYYSGEAPVISLPLYVADPDVLDVVSPIASRHAGQERRVQVTEYTLALFPEQVLLNDDGQRGTLAYTGSGTWTIDSGALSTDQETALGQSLWLWRCHFTRPTVPFQHEDGGKAVGQAEIHVMQDFDRIEGHQLYTVGDPYDSGIFIAQTVS